MMASTNKSLRKFSVTTAALLLLAIIVVAARAQDANTQPPQTSRIVLTAVDKDLRFVTTLKAEDLEILEDGKVQRITGFQQVTNQPVALAILIDASASREKTLPEQKLAATSFIDSIIRAGKDEAAVATFTGTLRVEQKLTNEVALLHQAIARAEFVPPPGYRGGGLVVGPLPPISRTPAMLASSTAIWDAVLTACHDLFLPSSGQGRHAIILLTDGEDTISKSKMSDAVDRAIRDNVAIYSIGIGDSGLYGVNKDGLRKLSERTGGRAFFPKHGADFQNIFAEIGEDLRTQYIITYTPTTSAGPARKIKVEIVNPALRKADIQLSYQQVRPQVTPRK